jgi:glycosyltransferase 2 family protein
MKLSVSIFFLIYVFGMVRWEHVWQEIKAADTVYLVLYLFLGFVGVFISSVKWLALAKPHGVSSSLPLLLLLYMVGYFFNNFLPTSVGGDVVRAYELGRISGKKPEAMASVFMERFSGYATLVVFALIATAFDRKLQTDIRLAAPVALATIGAVGLAWAVLSPSWLQLFQKRFPAKIVQKLVGETHMFQEAIYMYKHHPIALLFAGGYSILFYLVSILTVYAGCLTFNAEVSFASLVAVVPVILILFMIPLSLGGIGVQEWAYYFVLQIVGVPATVGLSLGLLFRARSLAFGVIGGAIYPFVNREPRVTRGDAPQSSRIYTRLW